MSSFSGFSEADILKLQNGEKLTSLTPKNTVQQHTVTLKKYPPAMLMKSKPHKQDVRKKVLENKLNTSQTISTDLPDEAKFININLSPCNTDDSKNISKEQVIDKTTKDSPTHKVQEVTSITTSQSVGSSESEKKYIDLDEFKLKQKYMEEQNRIRKEQVAKALENRTKRTQQEQQKLVEIQDQFKKLDATLSNDVKILRKHIESASYDYMEAHKKYHRIEKEFLEAKMFLHQKLEKKELLTEHLCAIIEKNEERKADKLNELLQKLEILDGANANAIIETSQDNGNTIQDAEISSNP